MEIHPTALVESGARLGEGAVVGPYCIVGAQASLGPGVRLLSHVVISGRTEIGALSIVHPFAVLGGPPQHLAHAGEETRLIVGERATIREHATLNCGAVAGGGITRVGADCMFMAASHVAHDCVVGDHVVLANNATLGGHVRIGNHAFLGGLCAVHQHCRIGDYAFVGGCAAVAADLIPFGSATGNHAVLSGLNIVGMKRRGFDREAIHAVRGAYRMLFSEDGTTFRARVGRAEAAFPDVDPVATIIAFIREEARRPIMAPAR